jgi:hypothetical protein
MTQWSDPEVFWLNVTNAALGLVVVAAVAALLVSLGGEILARVRASSRDGAHTYRVPGLGTTLADGGEKIEGKQDSDQDSGQEERRR